MLHNCPDRKNYSKVIKKSWKNFCYNYYLGQFHGSRKTKEINQLLLQLLGCVIHIIFRFSCGIVAAISNKHTANNDLIGWP